VIPSLVSPSSSLQSRRPQVGKAVTSAIIRSLRAASPQASARSSKKDACWLLTDRSKKDSIEDRSGICDLSTVLTPFTSLIERFTCPIKNLGPVKAVRWVARNAGPYGHVVELFAKATTDALDRPDGAVLGCVFEQDGVTPIVETAQRVGVTKGFAHNIGGDGCIDRWGRSGWIMYGFEQDESEWAQVATGGSNAGLEGDDKVPLTEQASCGIGEVRGVADVESGQVAAGSADGVDGCGAFAAMRMVTESAIAVDCRRVISFSALSSRSDWVAKLPLTHTTTAARIPEMAAEMRPSEEMSFIAPKMATTTAIKANAAARMPGSVGARSFDGEISFIRIGSPNSHWKRLLSALTVFDQGIARYSRANFFPKAVRGTERDMVAPVRGAQDMFRAEWI